MADAILKAAVKPDRVVKVGTMSHLNTATAKFAPALGEKMAAKQADRQQYDQPPVNPEGALHQAGGTGHVYGPGKEEDQERILEESMGPGRTRTTR